MSRSYHDSAKALAMSKQKQAKTPLYQVYAQMVLDEMTLNFEKERLRKAIDVALENRDKKTFDELSKRYREICKH